MSNESCCSDVDVGANARIDTEDTDSIECFQNYTAAEVFVQGLAGLIDQQDVESMIRAQKQILQRFEKTNEMLSNCNTLSVSRLKVANQQFKNYKQLLVDIKKDLDYTFKKINVLKSKLRSQYPDSIAATSFKIEESNSTAVNNISLLPTSDSQENDSNISELAIDSHPPVADEKSCIEHIDKKMDVSDSNSSESGEADSHVESVSISTSDTA